MGLLHERLCEACDPYAMNASCGKLTNARQTYGKQFNKRGGPLVFDTGRTAIKTMCTVLSDLIAHGQFSIRPVVIRDIFEYDAYTHIAEIH